MSRLPEVVLEPPTDDDEDFGTQASLDRVLLLLVDVNHDSEYKLAFTAAGHFGSAR